MLSFGIEISIEGPVNTAGLRTPAYGVDTAFLRDKYGRLILSGELVKGVVREMLTAMSNAAPDKLSKTTLDKWFGKKPDEREAESNGALEPNRACVYFRDFVLDGDAKPDLITRILVDEESGSVSRGMMQVIETAIPSGGTGVFRGRIDVTADCNEVEKWICKALWLTPALGGVKSAGFGHIDSIRNSGPVPLPTARFASALPGAGSADVVKYIIDFDGPFLVGSQSISGNIFKGSTTVPGGALKGALADILKANGDLAKLADALDKTIFRHAMPVRIQDGRPELRPQAIPRSLYSFRASGEEPELLGINDALDEAAEPWAHVGAVVTFQDNWKSDAEETRKTLCSFGHSLKPTYDIRTRTSIEKGQDDIGRGTASTGQLFTNLAVDPPSDYIWIGEIAQGAADPKDFHTILTRLADAVLLIGKRSTLARIAIIKIETESASLEPFANTLNESTWRLVLQTDALMHAPKDIFAKSDAPSKEEQLRHQYQNYFANALNKRRAGDDPICSEDIRLRYYARQRWAGGYQALRFPNSECCYYPHLLTEEGSVFELTVPSKVNDAVRSFVKQGLPLPHSIAMQALQYRRSPFNPENGYGEVMVYSRPLAEDLK